MKLKLIDILSDPQVTQAGTCELCFHTITCSYPEFIFEKVDTGERFRKKGYVWDWGDYSEVYIDNVIDFAAWVVMHDFEEGFEKCHFHEFEELIETYEIDRVFEKMPLEVKTLFKDLEAIEKTCNMIRDEFLSETDKHLRNLCCWLKEDMLDFYSGNDSKDPFAEVTKIFKEIFKDLISWEKESANQEEQEALDSACFNIAVRIDTAFGI